MHIQHGASVLVSDGRKALFMRNEGDAEFPDLRLLGKWEQPVPADRDLRSGAPGRTFSSHGGSNRRSSYEETNFHEQAEVEFASAAAEFLNEQLNRNAVEELIIVAPPRTLAVLRKHLHADVVERITAEIDKDLVKHPTGEIERLLASYPEPA